MSGGYTPLFSSIVMSSIWSEDDQTRIVWITMLALADAHGLVEGSLPALADVARVSLEDCDRAIKALSAVDPYSRSKKGEGRRIVAVEGGWRIVNYEEYKQKAHDRGAKYRMRRLREQGKFQDVPKCSQDVPKCSQDVPTGSHYTLDTQVHVPPDLPNGRSAPPKGEAENDPKKSTKSKPKKLTRAQELMAIAKLPIPENLRTPQFLALWADWQSVRATGKGRITLIAAKRQLKHLSEVGESEAICRLQTSIENGWQGLFFGDEVSRGRMLRQLEISREPLERPPQKKEPRDVAQDEGPETNLTRAQKHQQAIDYLNDLGLLDKPLMHFRNRRELLKDILTPKQIAYSFGPKGRGLLRLTLRHVLEKTGDKR